MSGQEIITRDDDDIDGVEQIDAGQSLAIGLTRAEIDQQIATARQFPRSPKKVAQRVLEMATLDEESAEECIYALPRGNKPIKGPSIRFAEILKQSFGNCRAATRVVHVDRIEKYVEAEGVFHDLETNSATSARVRRRISDKNGRLFSDDMIIVTGNAAASIALRNAILGGIPKPVWRRAFEVVQRTIAGDHMTLVENRQKAVAAFAHYGVKPEQVLGALRLAGEEDITLDHIITLRGMFSALKNGEATVEEMFERPEKKVDKDYNPLLPQGAAKTEVNSGQAPIEEKSDPVEARPDGAALADTLKSYSKALMRAQQAKSLTSIDEQFWTGKTKPTDRKSLDKFAEILGAHAKRCNGDIEPAEVDNIVKKVIAR